MEGGQSRGQDSGVTDEKLFLESTGFGEPKRFTKDHEGDSELASLEPTNIDMASFQRPGNAARPMRAGAPSSQLGPLNAAPILPKRFNSNSRYRGFD